MEIKSDRVDLTENRDFGDTTRTIRSTVNRIFSRDDIINIEDLVHIDLDTIDLTEYGDPSETFPTGSVKNIRIHKKEMEFMGYGDIKKCERCGKKLLPWEDSGVCEACFDELEGEVLQKIPWEN